MTELSALAGSEGYAACDDEASVELAAKWRTTEAQSVAPVSIGRSCGRVDFIVKKGRRGLFLTYAERPDFRAF